MRTPSSSSANVYFLVFNAESHRYFDGFVGQGVCPSQTDETETSASCLEVAGIWHRATTSLDAVSGCPVATLHHRLKILSQHLLGQEASNKSISSSIGVYNLFLGYGSDGEGVQLAMLNSDDWVAPLGDHHKSAAAAVLLGQLSNLHGDLADVGGVETEALRIGGGLRLVAEDYVGEWQHGGHLVLEELAEERSGKVEAVGFAHRGTVLGRLQH